MTSATVHRAIDRTRRGRIRVTDASNYRQTPIGVVAPRSADEAVRTGLWRREQIEQGAGRATLPVAELLARGLAGESRA